MSFKFPKKVKRENGNSNGNFKYEDELYVKYGVNPKSPYRGQLLEERLKAEKVSEETASKNHAFRTVGASEISNYSNEEISRLQHRNIKPARDDLTDEYAGFLRQLEKRYDTNEPYNIKTVTPDQKERIDNLEKLGFVTVLASGKVRPSFITFEQNSGV